MTNGRSHPSQPQGHGGSQPVPLPADRQPARISARRQEKGYPWLFTPRHTWMSLLITGTAVMMSVVVYLWYRRSGALAGPAGWLGLLYATLGTGSFLYALLAYRLYRRGRHRLRPGRLHTRMLWHGSLATIGMALLLMHSFGHLDPHLSGTYALYGLLVTIGSGGVGRLLDHVLPRLITMEIDRALSVRPRAAHSSHERRGRGVQSPSIPVAMRAEYRVFFYRGIIHSWRSIHAVLALLTCGLIAWHLVFVFIFSLRGHLTLP